MIQSTANDSEVSWLNQKMFVVDLVDRLPRMSIEQLKVVVTVHPNTMSSVENEIPHIDRKGRVKGPNVKSFGIDLWLDHWIGFFPGESDCGHKFRDLKPGNETFLYRQLSTIFHQPYSGDCPILDCFGQRNHRIS